MGKFSDNGNVNPSIRFRAVAPDETSESPPEHGVPAQSGWFLEATDDLTPPVTWTPVTGAAVVGDRLVLPRHASPGARYFRLRR